MRIRPIIPIGPAGLLVLAVAAVPILVSRSKPTARKIGKKLIEWGEGLLKEADGPSSPSDKKVASEEGMKHDRKDLLSSASPAAKEEIKEVIATHQAHSDSPPKAKTAAKKSPAKPKAGATTNPKKSSTTTRSAKPKKPTS
jgi:hypothetical protein